MRAWQVILTAALGAGVMVVLAYADPLRGGTEYLWGRARGGYSVADRVGQFGPAVDKRVRPMFQAVGLRYPPSDLALLAFKDARVLELYARESGQAWRFVKAYPVLAASGGPGPKMKEGDRQVPEGVYRLESLNPNSRFHVSLRLNYPNEFDRAMARTDGRRKLGGDIMIHGNSVSIGCLAMGDEAAEELFVLSALAGREHVRVVISPTDFRAADAPDPVRTPRWVTELYAGLRDELRRFQNGTPAPRGRQSAASGT